MNTHHSIMTLKSRYIPGAGEGRARHSVRAVLKSLRRARSDAPYLLCVMLLVSGCGKPSSEPQSKPASPVPVRLVPVKTGEATRSITLPGNVLAFQQATLYAKVAGYVKTISVDKGDSVRAGALLADIEVPELL